MSEENQDPSANTQAFRAFANQNEPGQPVRNNLRLFFGLTIALVIVLLVAAVLMLA
jgi:hypothetical protein